MKGCLLTILLVLGWMGQVFAQVSHGGTPWSVIHGMSATSVAPVTMPAVYVAALLAEDASIAEKGQPYRFGKDIDVQLGLDKDGAWTTLPNGDRLWRLRIKSAGAFSINLIFSRFYMPEGAAMYVYTADGAMRIGAFTDFNNKEHGKFSTTVLQGDDIVIEYNEPRNVAGQGQIAVSKVIHGYKNSFFGTKDGTNRDFNDSGSCNNDVACPEAAGWENEIDATLIYLLSNNTRVCSGAMLNNVRQDYKPYFLSANHCYSGDYATWIFMFNYQSAQCSPRQNGPTNQTVSGSSLRARRNASDFALFELSVQPPASYEVYYAGWSNVDTEATSAVGIHHPAGDIKKISFENDALFSGGYFSTSGNTHWRVNDWDDGTTEGGSSGSPLFDQNHRVIGQLHGGGASCFNNQSDYYGKFAESWDAGGSASSRLRDWLDPDNTGATVINGAGINVAPVALINSLGTQFCVGDTIPLSDSSSGADSWVWSFPGTDLPDINTQDPGSIVFNSPGFYDVSLQVSNSVGTDLYNLPIIVTAPQYQLNVDQPSAPGANDGVARVIPLGLTSFTIAWSNGVIAATNAGLAEGEYTVTVTDGNGCKLADTVVIAYVDPSVGINAPAFTDQLLVYPIPAQQQLFVELPVAHYRYQLMDATGRVVVAETEALAQTARVDISTLQAGVYILQVTAGQQTAIKRIVVQ